MSPDRFREITGGYAALRIAVVGDYCLDRYLEIDPEKQGRSIETGLPVHQVVRVRAQPGGAGTVLANLAALGVGTLHAVGFCGEDGEGYELRRALSRMAGVRLDHFFQTAERRTFTYCKPLLLEPGAPRELSRMDSKNWSPTSPPLRDALAASVVALAPQVDAMVLMEQVDEVGTGVLTEPVLAAAGAASRAGVFVLADSRRGLRDFPPVALKMNAAELGAIVGGETNDLAQAEAHAMQLAERLGRPVFVTLAERGIVGAGPDGQFAHAPALPVRGPIDIVGAGDAVTANLATALAAGAGIAEAMEIAMRAASVVVHQLGSTGTATLAEIESVAGSA